MPASLDELLELLDLEQIDLNLFRGRQPRTRLQRVFGGQVASQALMAATRTTSEERLPHSLHAYFLRSGDTAVPIVYDVERTRDGSSFSSRRVVARQHGQPIFYLSASFQVAETGFDHQDTAPEVPAPDDCPTLGEVLERISGRPIAAWDEEWAALDVRYAGDSRPGGAIAPDGRTARARVWVRASGPIPDQPALHECVLAYASDLTVLAASLVPHGTFIGDPRLRTASIDHAMWFHRAFRADAWLLYDQVSPSASGGRGFSTGELFTQSGALVASVAQEGLIRQVELSSVASTASAGRRRRSGRD